jgi:hypothetical protein
MKVEAKVMQPLRIRQRRKESRGVRNWVKKAERMEPHMPPMATRLQA